MKSLGCYFERHEWRKFEFHETLYRECLDCHKLQEGKHDHWQTLPNVPLEFQEFLFNSCIPYKRLKYGYRFWNRETRRDITFTDRYLRNSWHDAVQILRDEGLV